MTIKYRVKTSQRTKAQTNGTHTQGGKSLMTTRFTMDYMEAKCHMQMLKAPRVNLIMGKAKSDGYATVYFEEDDRSIQISVRRIKV